MSHNPREYKTQIPYDEFGYSGKTKRFMTIAKRIAWNSEAEDYKHGALLVRFTFDIKSQIFFQQE